MSTRRSGHRDLKPENIFIVPDAEAPGGERAKILDFGIAKLARGQTGSVRTHTNVVMGTPIYMSPEQCKGGKHVGDRVDVYALGVILFEMLAGRPPFVAEEAGEYIGMHLFKDPPSLKSLVPAVSPGLHRIVDLMLLKDPQVRPTMIVAVSTLKMLGNLTSDVVSLSALSGDAARPRVSGNLQPVAPPLSALEAALPPPDDEVETLLLKPGNLRAQVPLPIRPKGAAIAAEPRPADKPPMHSLPPDWQPVELAAAPAASLGNLDPDASNTKLPQPRGRGLARQLRRLRFRIKQQIYKWVGLPITEQRTTPSGTMLLRRRNAVLLIAVAVATAIALAVLFAGERTPAPGGTLSPQPPAPMTGNVKETQRA